MFKTLKNQLFFSSMFALIFLLLAVFFITRDILLPAIVLIAVVCIYLVFLGMWFTHSVELPLIKLTETAQRIASGSYGIKVDKIAEDEIGALTDELNIMSEKIGIAEKSRTDFISQISHELRTPLTAIEGWAETIAYDEALQGDSLRGIHIISKEAERLTRMVSELLEFARIQDGRFNLKLEFVDISAELEDSLFIYGELLRQAGVELNYSQPDSDIPLIYADPERLKQVFLNLLDNATKHGCDGSQIDVALTEDADSIFITIRDYGHGIPKQELPHVKEKFYKGSSKNRGTGIGLAVCDEICQRHGGELRIENAEGGGCIATIILPKQTGESYGK